jgi:signal transduction histidine kinase
MNNAGFRLGEVMPQITELSWSSLIESIKDTGIGIFSPDLVLHQANSALGDILQIDLSQLAQDPSLLLGRLIPQDIEKLGRAVHQNHSGKQELNIIYHPTDDQFKVLNLSIHPFLSDNPNSDNLFVLMARDITDQVREHDIVETLLSVSPDRTCIVNRNGQIITLSNGKNVPTTQGMVGQQLAALLPDNPEVSAEAQTYIEKALQTGIAQSQTLAPVETSGAKNFLRLRYFPLPHGEEVLIMIQDVTELMLQAIRKEMMLRMVAHDVKTPITHIKLLLGLIQMRSEKFADRLLVEEASTLAQIHEATGMIGDIFNSIEYVIQVISGEKFVLQTQSCDICELIGHTVDIFGKPVSLHLPKGSNYVHIDPKLIREAIINLLNNAAKFAGDQGPIELSLEFSKFHVLVKIIDHGPGISDADKPEVFKLANRGTDKTKAVKEGSGYGLTIAHAAITAHNGTIDIKDTPGGGATFVIKLPIVQVEA